MVISNNNININPLVSDSGTSVAMRLRPKGRKHSGTILIMLNLLLICTDCLWFNNYQYFILFTRKPRTSMLAGAFALDRGFLCTLQQDDNTRYFALFSKNLSPCSFTLFSKVRTR